MAEELLHRYTTYAHLSMGVVTWILVTFVAAPYGRHARSGFGPSIHTRLAWILMELPAVVVWAIIFGMGDHAQERVPLALLALWQLHYVQRVFIFPFRIRAKGKTTPISIVLSAVAFNVLNAYVVARWVSHFGVYDASWLSDPRFVLGSLLFLTGFLLNVQSDGILARLRKPGETGYKIPQGGLFRWISCPNYFAEMLEWFGFALATWSLAGFAFAFYTVANLAPRALTHHRWYKEQFPEYPADRRALVPFVL